jgi:hypothetical protein
VRGGVEDEAEPVFVNVYRAQESIPPGWESIPRLLKRFTNTGSGVSEEEVGSRVVAFFMDQLVFQERNKNTFNQMKKLNNKLDKKLGPVLSRNI